MIQIMLREIPRDDYKTLYTHMERDFPAGEIAPFFAIKSNLDKKIYDGYYITGEADLGYALITAPEGYKYALINYFAIFPEYRSRGYGSAFLQMLPDRYPDRTFVIEVEDPSARKEPERREAAERRVKFYVRAGYSIVPTARARIFGADMLIMACPAHEQFSPREVMRALYLPALGSKHWLRFVDVRDI